MPHWKQEQLQRLLDETNEQRILDMAVALAQQLGMEYFSFATLTHNAAQQPRVTLYNNYPEAWNQRYKRCRYIEIDPVVVHCHTSLLPILWQDEVFKETPEFWEDAQNHGLRYGWSHSAHDVRHNESILSVARSHSPIDADEFYASAGQTLWLCNLMHTLIVNKPNSTAACDFGLSIRECEVLKWSAAGKTASDIATILALSKSTVDFHIRRIINKMKASNKAGAIAIAAMNGLLE